MGALKLVRTSTKLDDFDALFLHNVCFFQQTALSVVFILRTNAFLDTLEVERTCLEGPPILDPMSPHTAVIPKFALPAVLHAFLLLAPPCAPQLNRTRRSSYSLFL